MVTHVIEISTPPTPADPPAEFEQKAAQVWSELHQAVPQMNQQADEIEQIGVDAQTAKERAIQESDAALGYRNEARAARDVAIPASASATDMATQAVTAKEHAEEARDDARAAAQDAVNRVAKTSDTGAALLPEGSDAQRPVTGSIPAGALVMRGNTQDPADYKPEFWDRVAAGWKVFADRAWVTAAITALKNWVNEQIGYAVVYPNGGTEAAPALVAVNSQYVLDNPFPGHHVIVVAEVTTPAGVWVTTGWLWNSASGGQGFAAGVRGDKIVVTVGSNAIASSGPNFAGGSYAAGDVPAIATAKTRVKVWKVKGGVA